MSGTVKIHGKEYVLVNTRVAQFRQDRPDWSIDSTITHISDGSVIIKTVISDETGRVRSTGMSHEIKTAKGINQTSHIENAETSAVGRALAFLGYGIETSIASAEEVSQAIAQQKDKGDFQIFSGAFWEAKNLQDLNEIAANVKNYDWTAEERDQLAYVYKQVKGELEK